MNEKITVLNRVRRMLGFDLDSWNNILLFFLAVAAIAAALVGFATYATIQLAKQEAADSKKDFESYKLTVEGQVADAKKEGIEAGKMAGNAMLRAAELERQAEQLRKETAEANAHTKQAELQLEQLRFPRSLDVEKFTKAVSNMQPVPIEIVFDPNTPDAPSLAVSIWIALAQAKWPVSQPTGPSPIGPPSSENLMGSHGTWVQAAGGGPWGISVVTNDEPNLDSPTSGAALVKALLGAVIGPPSQVTYGRAYGDLPAGRLRIVVGPKLP